MLKNFELKQLKLSHLRLFQKHIELGQDHLKAVLSPHGMEELCSLDMLDAKTEKEVKLSKKELAGAFALTFNSFLTTILGVWIGANGIVGPSANSKFLFISFIIISAGIGTAIGILNCKFTKSQIENRINERKLQDIQLHILNFLNHQIGKETLNSTEEIKQLLMPLQIAYLGQTEFTRDEDLHEPEFCLKWLDRIDQWISKSASLEDPEMHELYKKIIQDLRDKIKNSPNTSTVEMESKHRIPSLLRPLVENSLPAKKRKKSWARTNWKHLLTAGIPFLYASFNSIFSYLTMAKKISMDIGWQEVYELISNPHASTIQLILVIFITLYFGFTFFVTNYKNFHRDQEIGKAHEKVIKRQEVLNILDNRLIKTKEVLACMQEISKIHQIREKMTPLNPLTV